jgi:hypothetical protein
MAQVIIITTPKGATSNAYCDEDKATVILLQHRLHSSKWEAATIDEQRAALIWATRLIDSSFDFDGYRVTKEQALRMPRSGLIDDDGYQIDPDTIPVILERGTAEYAAALVKEDRTADPDLLGKGFTSVSLGEISVDVGSRQSMQLVPEYVAEILRPIARLRASVRKGGRVVEVVRA